MKYIKLPIVAYFSVSADLHFRVESIFSFYSHIQFKTDTLTQVDFWISDLHFGLTSSDNYFIGFVVNVQNILLTSYSE